jgi:MEMO1 family protein
VPHAGYMYSGPVAAHAYRRLAASGEHASIVVLGPNHTGQGAGLSTMTSGQWSTPLGNVEIDTELAETIVKRSGLVDVEDEAHRHEHSIEVQLPFLQYLYGGRFKFVPLCMMLQDLDTSQNIGKALVESVSGRDVVILASSDWTHYESQQVAKTKDLRAIDAVLRMDETDFQRRIEESGVSACGFGPVTALTYAAKTLGAKKAELLSYKTSGDITGDESAVVGYAAIAFSS